MMMVLMMMACTVEPAPALSLDLCPDVWPRYQEVQDVAGSVVLVRLSACVGDAQPGLYRLHSCDAYTGPVGDACRAGMLVGEEEAWLGDDATTVRRLVSRWRGR